MQSMICGERVSFFQSQGKENKSEKEFDLNVSNTYVQIHTFKTEIVVIMLFSGVGMGLGCMEGILPTALQIINTVASLGPQHIRLFIPVWLQTPVYKNIHSNIHIFAFFHIFEDIFSHKKTVVLNK